MPPPTDRPPDLTLIKESFVWLGFLVVWEALILCFLRQLCVSAFYRFSSSLLPPSASRSHFFLSLTVVNLFVFCNC